MICSCAVCQLPDSGLDSNQETSFNRTNQGERGFLEEDSSRQPYQRTAAIVDSVDVWVLGEKILPGGVPQKQLDLYSGIDGLHIRTIPGTRWRNPVSIGAGIGYLAVIDRFHDMDVLRITDEYGGATSAGFLETGFPIASVAWDTLPDICQIPTKKGQRFSGVQITTDGFLIAGVQDETETIFIHVDIQLLVQNSITILNSLLVDGTCSQCCRFNPPYRFVGTPIGSPSAVAPSGAGTFEGTKFVSIVQDETYGSAVILCDWASNKILGMVGLPNGYDGEGVVITSNIVSALMRDRETDEQIIVRLSMVQENNIFSRLINERIGVPSAQEYNVDRTFIIKDLMNEPVETTGELINYLKVSARLNHKPTVSEPLVQETEEDSVGLDVDWQTLFPETRTQVEANRDREPINTTYDTFWYGSGLVGSVTIPAQIIPLVHDYIPKNEVPGFGTRQIASISNTASTVGESWLSLITDVDIQEPIFTLVHGTHYDWLSEGGFTYGCKRANGESSFATNGITPLSIATYRNLRKGSLKELPDLKVALIDRKTGRFLYAYPKPIGVRVYGGDYAGLRLSQPPAAVRTVCTEEMESLAQDLDGWDRDTRDKFNNNWENYFYDLNKPFDLVQRRSIITGPVQVQLTEKSWSNSDPDFIFITAPKETWAQNMENPGRATKILDTVYYPQRSGLRNAGIHLQLGNSAGFYFMNLPKELTTRRRQLEQQLSSLSDDLTAQQSLLSQLQSDKADTQEELSTATGYMKSFLTRKLSRLEDAIATTNAEISSLQNQISTIESELSSTQIDEVTGINALDLPIYEVSQALKNMVFSNIEPSGTQSLDPVTGGSMESVTPNNGSLYSVVTIDGVPAQEMSDGGSSIEPIRRAVVIEPNVRSWVGVGITLDRWDQIRDGVEGWDWPEFSVNGLGVQVADYVTGVGEGFGITGSAVYERGYVGAEGAAGVWEVEIKLNGKDPKTVAEQVTYPEQIYQLAPADAVSLLSGTFDIGRGGISVPNRYSKGKVWWSNERITSIQVTCKLVNYAYTVYRTGYRTVRRVNGVDSAGTPPCFQTDPGFYADNTCESLGCGNVACFSYIFRGLKLYDCDPVYDYTKQVLWEGRYVFDVPNDPYRNLNIETGLIQVARIQYDFNSTMNRYKVDIRDGKHKNVNESC